MPEHTLARLAELRVEVGKGKEVDITLLDGSAEIFGAELSLGSKVTVRGQSVAVFTWHGCRVQLDGEPDVCYIADETPNSAYINAHHVLQNLRNEAATAAAAGGAAAPSSPPRFGPRVAVVGPTDSGKSTLCRQLLNWAVRAGAAPTYVDLDVGQGSITAPGCVAATPIEVPVSVEDGYPVQTPLVYYFGHSSPREAPELYTYLVGRLASVLDRRAEAGGAAAAGGAVINTLGWVDGQGFGLLVDALRALRVDVVLVMEQDRLASQLSAALGREAGASGRPVSVVRLPKSGGVVTREGGTRKDARTARVREYFYGAGGAAASLLPASQSATAESLRVFRVGGAFRAPSSALPLGASAKSDPLKLAPARVGPDLLHSLLAVSHAPSPDQVLSSNVAGFVLVTGLDAATGRVTFLSPCPGTLPGRYLVAGSLKAFLD